MNFFTLLWLDGKKQYITGETIEKAFTKAGYGAGALAALDFYLPGLDFYYVYDAKNNEWKNLHDGSTPGRVNLYNIAVDGVKFIPINIQAIKPDLNKLEILFEEVSDETFFVHIHDLERIWELKLS